jgi:hypothetical protein
VTFSLWWMWSGAAMGAALGRLVPTACVLCFTAIRGRRRPSGPKGQMGRLAVGPIGLKARGNSFQK